MELRELDGARELLKMQERNEVFLKIEEEIDKRIEEQEELFGKYTDKLQPVFDFLKNKRFYYRNPNGDIPYTSSFGPVLAYDSKEHTLLVYSLEHKYIAKQPINNGELTYYNSNSFFANYDFQTAINGLLDVLTIYDRAEKALNENLSLRLESIEKYSI